MVRFSRNEGDRYLNGIRSKVTIYSLLAMFLFAATPAFAGTRVYYSATVRDGFYETTRVKVVVKTITYPRRYYRRHVIRTFCCRRIRHRHRRFCYPRRVVVYDCRCRPYLYWDD